MQLPMLQSLQFYFEQSIDLVNRSTQQSNITKYIRVTLHGEQF